MSDPLVELSRTKNETGSGLVVEDYTKHPRLCRDGVWVGWKTTFTETVTLAFEHTRPEDSYVGWAINGIAIIDPGFSSGTPPWGAPVPGFPTVTYQCPVGGFFHQLSFTSASGMAEQCLSVQVLYRGPSEASAPAHRGPSATVCLSGFKIEWPEYKLAAERSCLIRHYEIMRRYVEIAHVNPGDPVEWFAGLGEEEAVRVGAEIETIEKLNPNTQHGLASAIKADLAGLLRARMPGGTRFRG